jgi:hydroxylamine reductase (hybrid-cluster protein)
LFLCLQIKISTGFNTFVGILSVSNLAKRYFGLPTATEVRIQEIHEFVGVMDEKNLLLAGHEPDGGKALPKI